MVLPSLVETILTALWLMLPAYLANMAPVFVGGGTPIDFGKTWKDGKRILGNGKTWRGLLLGSLVAAIATFPLQWVAGATAWGDTFPTWGPAPWWFVFVLFLGLGALAGDAIESFFKRRTGRDRGAPWFPFDQLDFVVGSMAFGLLAAYLLQWTGATPGNLFVDLFTLERVIAIVLLTPGLHLLVNWIGYKIGTKDVPW